MMIALKTFSAMKYSTETMFIIKKKRMTKNGLPLDVLELDNAIKTITTTRTLPLALMDGLTEVPTCFGIYFASL